VRPSGWREVECAVASEGLQPGDLLRVLPCLHKVQYTAVQYKSVQFRTVQYSAMEG